MKRQKRRLIIYGFCLLALFLGLFLVWHKKTTFSIKPPDVSDVNGTKKQEPASPDNSPKSPISGVACENAARRPLAIMLSSDSEARSLSGISQADMVFEMQVVQGSITRPMAVFVCENPSKIGSVRSARQDFIPLANGLDAIYVHWGGSHFALDILKTGVIDDLDALVNPYSTFYRQSGVAAPYNGFTSITRIMNAAEKLGFRTEDRFVGYPHLSDTDINNHGQEKKVLGIGYSGEFKVSYQYDPETNSYLRYRGGTKEIDKNTGKQVEAKNVVIMRAISRELEGQYNTVQVTGSGQAEYYLNGQQFKGAWKKDKNNDKSKLFFYDDKGQEIKFVPGAIWVEIVDPGQLVTWQQS